MSKAAWLGSQLQRRTRALRLRPWHNEASGGRAHTRAIMGSRPRMAPNTLHANAIETPMRRRSGTSALLLARCLTRPGFAA